MSAPSQRAAIDPAILTLYDESTPAPLPRTIAFLTESLR